MVGPSMNMHASSIAEPLYVTVKNYVRRRIDSGEWAPNARIPSENEIVAELCVSRMTANRALRELAAEGSILRVPGVGSFVAPRKSSAPLLDVKNIADEIRARGNVHSSRIVLLQEEATTPEVGDALDLPVGSPVFHSIITHQENEVPIQIEDRFVNPSAAPHYMAQPFDEITPNAYLTQIAPISRVHQLVEAVSAQPWECRLLSIPDIEPCLMIRRRTWSQSVPVTSVRLLYPGSRYRLEGSSP
jgi:GntR family transcriptional regulator, histidine utilization repressor